jgi:protein phosphatase
VRQANEDAFAVLPEQGLFIVADGIGGAAAGEAASQIAVEVVPATLRPRLSALRRNAARKKVEAAVREALQEVNDAMLSQGRQHSGVAGMGTTIVLAMMWRGSVLIAHLGDSRAYLYRDGGLIRLTEDHALAAQLVRWGKITESQAEGNPGRSTLLRYLGADEELVPDFRWIRPQVGDQLLLCSDGLTNMLSDDQIARVMSASGSLSSCCDRLIADANMAGGNDNITVLIIRPAAKTADRN